VTGADLRADCARCFALCCVAPAFQPSADFPISKPAGRPCPHLQGDFRCSIHSRLRHEGFAGCAAYDCFGAGQKVSQLTFGGQDWRHEPENAELMFEAFRVMRQLHELLWYLAEALRLPSSGPVRADLRQAVDETERLTHLNARALAGLEVGAHRDGVNDLLLRASELARSAGRRPGAGLRGADRPGAGRPGAGLRGADRPGAGLRGADLAGRDLSGMDLAGASLRGAILVGANLTGADLTNADLTGADLRGANLSGANLAASIFLLQSQLDAARGDHRTRLPLSLARPAHWAKAG
jgi:uncharacterized protein YjbI with pentapeptide repeats